jgi:hypothetical protein
MMLKSIFGAKSKWEIDKAISNNEEFYNMYYLPYIGKVKLSF